VTTRAGTSGGYMKWIFQKDPCEGFKGIQRFPLEQGETKIKNGGKK